AGNVNETDESEEIEVKKDEEKNKSNETRILVEPSYVRRGTFGNCQQKEMETKTDEHKMYDYCQKLVKVAENRN
ncbi:8379_t:CDS:2, partial [Gigaspora rosea]